MIDLETTKLRREEMIREAEKNRLARALRKSRGRRGSGLASALKWELQRIAGRLRKRSRTSKEPD